MADTKPMPPTTDTNEKTAALLAKERQRADAAEARGKELEKVVAELRKSAADVEKADAKMVEDNSRLAKQLADAGTTISDLKKQLAQATSDLVVADKRHRELADRKNAPTIKAVAHWPPWRRVLEPEQPETPPEPQR